MTHVARPTSRIETIYLAGKIEVNDWRHDIVEGLREHSPQSAIQGEISGLSKAWPILENAIFDRYHYTGPYFIETGHEGGSFHGEGSHGVGATDPYGNLFDADIDDHPHCRMVETAPWVVKNCQRAIQLSDVVFAWIENITCYGTLVELGYAKALDKLIWIASPRRYRDLWFVYEMADEIRPVLSSDYIGELHPKEILKSFLDGYERTHPTFSSPIEQAFWDEWNKHATGRAFSLVPQYPIGKYRVDFAYPPKKIAIELDGHATHSSPDAIAHDRKRQREIEEMGWHVIRFGGKEVYSNAFQCAQEAYRLLTDRIKP